METNWKKLTSKMADFHEEYGASIVSRDLDPLYSGNLLNLTEEEKLFSQEGEKISPKKIRRWLWEIKDERSLKRDGLVFWSVYDDEKKTSYAGFGVLVKEEIASRFPPTHVLGIGE